MPFVHTLVRSPKSDRMGWCAPVDLGEESPHYVSFVVPVDGRGRFFDAYSCEVVTIHDGRKSIATHEFSSEGNDAFLLRLAGREFWFHAKPAVKSQRRLPYVGRLRHPDFGLLFTEIEPERLEELDELCEKGHVFIIGCEPYEHYSGLQRHA
jgi:hypothetical protein